MAKCEHLRLRQTCSICSPEQVFNAYRYKALNQRKIGFTLTLDEFKKLVEQPCVFCGVHPQAEPMGIDRRDNHIGYAFWNCQSCCGPCNRLKSSFDQQTFLELVSKISRHQEALRRRKALGESPVAAESSSGLGGI